MLVRVVLTILALFFFGHRTGRVVDQCVNIFGAEKYLAGFLPKHPPRL